LTLELSEKKATMIWSLIKRELEYNRDLIKAGKGAEMYPDEAAIFMELMTEFATAIDSHKKENKNG
jgi:hypothetical protein